MFQTIVAGDKYYVSEIAFLIIIWNISPHIYCHQRMNLLHSHYLLFIYKNVKNIDKSKLFDKR